MNLNIRSQNSYFPLRSLPAVVIHHVAQYLDPRDRQNMAKVDRYLREVFNSPQLWKDVRVHFVDRKIDPQVLEIFRVRGITDVYICNINFELQTTALQPHVERLSLRVTRVSTLTALTKAASSGHLKLKSLVFGVIDYKIGRQSKVTFLNLFKCLPMLEEVSFGGDYTYDDSRQDDQQFCMPLTNETDCPLVVDLQQALCCTGKLTSISFTKFNEVGRSWLETVMIKNPHMRALSLSLIERFAGEGSHGEADPTECSNLRTLELRVSVYSTYRKIAIEVLSWTFPGNKQYINVTSLDLSGSNAPAIFPALLKFPALKKLNLTNSQLAGRNFSLQSLPKFQNLEWLELAHCRSLNGNQLLILSNKVGKTLCYLGLAKQGLITDSDLRDLAGMFPVLKTLDLTLCTEITDALLVEWYIKCDKKEWPQLRKLILTGCFKITQEVVDSVRLRSRNQLLIDTQLSKLRR